VSRLEGHFLGDLMVRTGRSPLGEGREVLGGVVSSALARGGAGIGARAAGVLHLVDLLRRARSDRRDTRDDPLERARRRIGSDGVEAVDREVHAELARAVEAALEGMG
jgi:hypothetical protein